MSGDSAQSVGDTPRAACHRYLQNADVFRPATAAEAEDLVPCGICFPEGVVDVELSELVIAGECDRAEAIHRDERTGDPEWVPPHDGGDGLANRLAGMSPDEVGGDA